MQGSNMLAMNLEILVNAVHRFHFSEKIIRSKLPLVNFLVTLEATTLRTSFFFKLMFSKFQILDLPKRERINFKLFCVIAALSERIKMLEPIIRKLINQLDFEALQVKMNRAKDLFYLLDDRSSTHAIPSDQMVFGEDLWSHTLDEESLPRGTISAESLAVELAAGGITEEHVNQVQLFPSVPFFNMQEGISLFFPKKAKHYLKLDVN